MAGLRDYGCKCAKVRKTGQYSAFALPRDYCFTTFEEVKKRICVLILAKGVKFNDVIVRTLPFDYCNFAAEKLKAYWALDYVKIISFLVLTFVAHYLHG